MRKFEKLARVGFLLLLLVSMMNLVNAQSYNETVRALNQSRIDLQELIEAGYNVLRINDTLSQANQLFIAQYALQQSGGTPDFSLIIERTKQITELRNQAEEKGDELNALKASLKNVPEQSEAHIKYNNAKKEFDDERYENVADFVEEAYIIISEEQALQTRFRAIYEAGTKTISNFLKKWWKEILYIIIAVSLLYIYLKKRFLIFLINRKIGNLNFEKIILKDLIKKSQYEYFHSFKIPEELYHIRLTKYAELIRDIDRQIPILTEEKAKLKGFVTENESDEDKYKRIGQRIKLISIILIVIILIVASLLVFFKVVSDTGLIAIISAFFILVLMLINAIIFIIRREREKDKPELIQEKKSKYIPSFVYNKINRLKLNIKALIDKVKNKREYRKLLKQKDYDERRRIRYIRKQKIILFIRKIKEKFKFR